jgi:hypothetical protein
MWNNSWNLCHVWESHKKDIGVSIKFPSWPLLGKNFGLTVLQNRNLVNISLKILRSHNCEFEVPSCEVQHVYVVGSQPSFMRHMWVSGIQRFFSCTPAI